MKKKRRSFSSFGDHLLQEERYADDIFFAELTGEVAVMDDLKAEAGGATDANAFSWQLVGYAPDDEYLESDDYPEDDGNEDFGDYPESDDDAESYDLDLIAGLVPGPIDAVLRWPANKVYFFKGNQCIRYDVRARRVDSGYPKPISADWRGVFSSGIDAAFVWHNRKAYFFKNSQYISYDLRAARADRGYPKSISERWRGVFANGIDAALNWRNRKAYFFKGNRYVRYDIHARRIDAGYPKPISARWPGVFGGSLDGAVNGDDGKAYFFKGYEYIRYDVRSRRADAGYPKPIGRRTATPAQPAPARSVQPAAARVASDARVYRTIQDVINDTAAVRRQAVLASVADFFPAFNVYPPNPRNGAGLVVGRDSGILDQGPWLRTYQFNGRAVATSCTTVNPAVMTASVCRNDSNKWSFNAGPAVKSGPSPAWVPCDKDHLPNVGDTYIVLNGWKGYYGHVGIVLHVPPNGNGLWITADGGQGGKPQQLAFLVPRWGLMGAVLPSRGSPSGSYPRMRPESDAGPFLSGATRGDIRTSARVPGQNDDVAGIISRLIFHFGPQPHSVSNPRRLEGYVDIDHRALSFAIDGQNASPAILSKCRTLQAKVNRVIVACLRGDIVGGAGT